MMEEMKKEKYEAMIFITMGQCIQTPTFLTQPLIVVTTCAA
jgi:hypothetical protein